MPRAKNKTELIVSATESYKKLQDFILQMTDKELNTPFDFSYDSKKKQAHWARDKNLRDVIMHLHEWQNLAIQWVKNNKAGNRIQFLRQGYNWKNYGNMNQEIWSECQNISLETAKQKLDASYKEILALIETMDDEELFSKNKYDWVGTSSIGQYFVSATASHYEWALKKLKEHKKTVQSKNKL